MKPRIYVAGPITGMPEYNFPAFNKAADRLRQGGWDVENPTTNPPPPGGTHDDSEAMWSYYMRLGLAQVLLCDAIGLLPGWENSRGATLELHVAKALGMDVYLLHPDGDDDHFIEVAR